MERIPNMPPYPSRPPRSRETRWDSRVAFACVLLGLFGLVLATNDGLWSSLIPDVARGSPIAKATRLEGEPKLRPSTSLAWRMIDRGERVVFQDDSIFTSESGRVRVVFDAGGELEIQPRSLVIIRAPATSEPARGWASRLARFVAPKSEPAPAPVIEVRRGTMTVSTKKDAPPIQVRSRGRSYQISAKKSPAAVAIRVEEKRGSAARVRFEAAPSTPGSQAVEAAVVADVSKPAAPPAPVPVATRPPEARPRAAEAASDAKSANATSAANAANAANAAPVPAPAQQPAEDLLEDPVDAWLSNSVPPSPSPTPARWPAASPSQRPSSAPAPVPSPQPATAVSKPLAVPSPKPKPKPKPVAKPRPTPSLKPTPSPSPKPKAEEQGRAPDSVPADRGPLTAPILRAPSPGMMLFFGTKHFFKWKHDDRSESHEVQFARDPDFEEVISTFKVGGNHLDHLTDEEHEIVYWRVRSRKGGETSPWSAPSEFSVVR